MARMNRVLRTVVLGCILSGCVQAGQDPVASTERLALDVGHQSKWRELRVEGTTDYADPPATKGLHLMQGPGYDQESTPGLIGAGAQIVVFTTGRGPTIGNAIAPVLKLASNTPIFERMSHDLDLSAGSVIDGTETIEEVGERVFDHVLACASGEVQAKAEETGHREFQVWAERAVSL